MAGGLPVSGGAALNRIAVVGGGIGGLAAAAFLHRAGLWATVYEQAPALGELGAGLVVAPNAARLLRRLPLESGLERAGVALESGWEFRRWADGSVLFAQQLGDVCTRRYGEHTWTMHRTDLLEVLRSAVPAEAIEVGRHCTGAAQDAGGVTLTFSSGAPVRAGVVIAADGIHSVLREHVTTASPPRESGLCAWRSMVPATAAPAMARRLSPGPVLHAFCTSPGSLLHAGRLSWRYPAIKEETCHPARPRLTVPATKPRRAAGS